MTQDRPPKARPHQTPEADAARLARLEREAAALRENLRRRKAQSRARDDAAPPGDSAPGQDNVES